MKQIPVLLIVLIHWLPNMVFAESHDIAGPQSFISPGSVCDPIFHNHGNGVEWRPWGLVNNNLSHDRWVVCPVTKYASSSAFKVTVAFFNTSASPVTAGCRLQEFQEGNQLKDSVRSVELQPATYDNSLNWTHSYEASSHVSLVCRLPPSVVLDSIMSEALAPRLSSRSVAQACDTSPITNPRTGSIWDGNDSLVQMENGTIVVNKDGDTWDPNDNHTIFEASTATGKRWYTIKGGSQLVPLQIYNITSAFTLNGIKYNQTGLAVKRPSDNECFQPEAVRVTGRRLNSCGDARIEWWGGEADVDGRCPFDQGSVLYLTDSFGDGAIDLLTAQQCDFKYKSALSDC